MKKQKPPALISPTKLKVAFGILLVTGILALWPRGGSQVEETARFEPGLSRSRLGDFSMSKEREFRRRASQSGSSTTFSTRQPLVSQEEFEAFKAWQEESARRAVDDMVSRTAAEGASELHRLLSDLGLEGPTIQQVQSNLVALHYLAVDAGTPAGIPLTELALARGAYDNNMRSLLSEDAYKRYRKYEESKPAAREYNMIKEHAATKSDHFLDESEADKIVDLIRDSGTTTTVTWHGPYDPLPQPIAGAEAIDKLQADCLALVKNANSLLTAAQEAGASEETLQVLQDYYTDKTQAAYEAWVFWTKPIEGIRAAVRVRAAGIIESQMSNQP